MSDPEPIDMVLHCPNCHTQHIDAPDEFNEWTNPPHRSHLCAKCGFVWRPADVPTNGVAAIKTQGKHDMRLISELPPGEYAACFLYSKTGDDFVSIEVEGVKYVLKRSKL